MLVLAGGISIGVEIAIGCNRGAVYARKSVTRVSTRDAKILTVVAAGEDGEADLRHVVVRGRRRLGAPDRAHGLSAADLELIVIRRKRLETSRLDLQRQTHMLASWTGAFPSGRQELGTRLDGVIDITRGERLTPGHNLPITLLDHLVPVMLENAPLETDGVRVRPDVGLGVVVIQRHGALDGDVAAVRLLARRRPRPQDHAVRVRVARGDAVREVQRGSLCGVRAVGVGGALQDLGAAAGHVRHVDSQVHMRVPAGRAVVVQVAAEIGGQGGRGGRRREGEDDRRVTAHRRTVCYRGGLVRPERKTNELPQVNELHYTSQCVTRVEGSWLQISGIPEACRSLFILCYTVPASSPAT